MKQQDIALIIITVGIAGLVALVIGNVVLGGTSRKTEVQTVQPLTSEFVLPDERFFNETSLNPTKDITIGEDGNPIPFKNSQ